MVGGREGRGGVSARATFMRSALYITLRFIYVEFVYQHNALFYQSCFSTHYIIYVLKRSITTFCVNGCENTVIEFKFINIFLFKYRTL